MIELVVDADPGDALLACTGVLKRLGGRIARYDIEAQTMEARLPGRSRPATVQLSAAPDPSGRARLRVHADGLGWWRRRRLRAELGRLPGRPTREGEDQR